MVYIGNQVFTESEWDTAIENYKKENNITDTKQAINDFQNDILKQEALNSERTYSDKNDDRQEHIAEVRQNQSELIDEGIDKCLKANEGIDYKTAYLKIGRVLDVECAGDFNKLRAYINTRDLKI